MEEEKLEKELQLEKEIREQKRMEREKLIEIEKLEEAEKEKRILEERERARRDMEVAEIEEETRRKEFMEAREKERKKREQDESEQLQLEEDRRERDRKERRDRDRKKMQEEKEMLEREEREKEEKVSERKRKEKEEERKERERIEEENKFREAREAQKKLEEMELKYREEQENERLLKEKSKKEKEVRELKRREREEMERQEDEKLTRSLDERENRRKQRERVQEEEDRIMRDELEQIERRKKEREELIKEQDEKIKRDEFERQERRKREKEEEERFRKEKENLEDQQQKERARMRKEGMENKRIEEEHRFENELKEKELKRKQRREEEARIQKEEEYRWKKEEEERIERRKRRQQEEELQDKKKQEALEEKIRKEEEQKREQRERKRKKREEEERRLEQEEEKRLARRQKYQEEEMKRAQEEENIKNEEKKKLEDELKRREELMKKREDDLRHQAEEFMKKEEELRKKRDEEKRKENEKKKDEEVSWRDKRKSREIEYSETELIDDGKLADLMKRRARLSRASPEADENRRDARRRPKFSTKLQDRQTLKGTRVRLTCNILTCPEDPPPDVEWFKNGYPVKEDEKLKVTFVDGVACLEMNSVTRVDSGEYTCTAKNRHGRVSTSCDLRVKGEEDQRPTAPTFTTSLRERYNSDDDELVVSCHVTGHPNPKITWLKDADQLPTSPRFHTSISTEGICKLIIKSPRTADSGVYTCHAENRVYRDEIKSTIHVQTILANKSKHQSTAADDSEAPKFITELCDQNVEENGTLSLQVETTGNPSPEVMWLFNGRSLPPSGKFRISASDRTHTLTVFQVTRQDLGTYSCKIKNKYGHAYTLSTVSFGSSRANRDKFMSRSGTEDSNTCAPTFQERPESLLTVGRNEEIRLSCAVQGEPTPRVTWYRGHHDISAMGRAHIVVRDNRHTVVMKEAQFTDTGTYVVEAKNSQGTCRAYCSIKVRELQRSRSDSPMSERIPPGAKEVEIRRRTGLYIRDVPGKVGTPRATDIGKNWVSLRWSKPDHQGGAPVTAFKVESWILGEEARWQELGVSPIASFDAYHMKPDREYLFRVTPRNKYGWGESVMTPRPTRIGRTVEPPSMPRSLPTQIRCMPGGTVMLEGQVSGDPTPEIRWYKDGSLMDTSRYPRFTTTISDGNLHNVFGYVHKVVLKIDDLQAEDEGRFEVEAVNPGGRVTSGTKVLPTYDCSVLQAQETINRSLIALSRLDAVTTMAPQFTMRLRDRRVQIGFPVRLTCQIVGAPKPTIQWFKDGEELSPDDTHTIWQEDGHFYTLEISSGSHEDAAMYSVQATNEYGSVMCKCRLVVDSGLKSYVSPMFLKELEDISVRAGDDIILQTAIEAYPTIGVVWHRDGQRIRPSRKHFFSLGADGVAVLMVSKAEYNDGGLYTCTAANEMGRVESYCRVSVASTDPSLNLKKDEKAIQRPMFVRKPRTIDAEEGDLVIIECEVAGDPKPSVRWLRDWLEPSVYIDGARFKEVGSGPVYRLEIPNCRLEDTGAYSILATNEHGEAKAVISLQVYTKGLKRIAGGCIKKGVMEHIPRVIRPLQDVRCCDGDSVTLEALIDAPETSLIRWEKQGKVLKEGGDIASEWDGSVARLKIKELYPEDEGEYSCIVFNDLGKAVTSATIVVEMADDKENDVTVQMEYRPDLSRRTTPSRTNTPSRYSRSPSVNFTREGSAHSWAGVGWREPSVNISHWRPLSRGSSPLLLGHRRTTPEPSARSKQRRAQRPKFYYIPHDRIVEEGETVTFQCAVKGVPLPRATWDKDSRKILPGGRIKMEEKNEMRLLEIPKVTQQDAGLYRVTIDNDLGREQATARLDVIKASANKYLGYVRTWHSTPSSAPRFTRTLPKTTLREGSKLTLETYYSGSPTPRVKWYRNRALLPLCKEFRQITNGKKASLQIENVSLEDAGTYTCFLISDAGRADCSTQVVVESLRRKNPEAPPVFLNPLTDVSALDGDEVRLTVKIEGSRPTKVLWVHKYKEITPSKDFRYEEGPGEGEYSLVIPDAYPKDSGIYFCEAYNAYGHVISHAKLDVVDPYAQTPSSPKICGPLLPMTVKEGDSTRFSIRLLGHPEPKVTWYLNDQEIVASEDIQLKIDEPEEGEGFLYSMGLLSPTMANSGVVTVVASNNEGTTSIQTTLKVEKSLIKKTEDKVKNVSLPNTESCSARISLSRSSPPSKSPVQRPKSIREMSVTGSQDSAYCSGRSSSLSVTSETDTQDTLSKLETLTTQEEQSENREAISSDIEEEIITHEEEEFQAFNDEDTGSVIISGPDDTVVLKGQSAVLIASFTGHPEPEVTWYKKDKEIVDGGKYTITTDCNETSLTIKDVTFDDCDKYTLKVRNQFSAHSSFASLAVEGYPEPPGGKPNLSDTTNTSVIVSWYGSTYDGGKAVIGYRIEGRKIGNVDWETYANRCHSTSFKVENLDKGGQYEFRIRAENIHGLSEPSKISNPVSLRDEYEESTSEISDDEDENRNSSAYKLGAVALEDGNLFSDRFDQHEEVGKGRFGIVYRVTEKLSGKRRAAKLIKCIRKEEREKVKEEISIMNSLRHPKLLQLLAAYERKKDSVMIMEYISGGELFERVVADDFNLTEKDCILFLRQICEGVSYMHTSSIVHLDLKPENILCVHRRSHQIKLIDFGLARKLDLTIPCRVLFGTPEFVAPEIINFEPISFASDMWSVGVICYVLLSGLSPFMGESDAETFSNITRSEYDFDDDAFDAISDDAKEFITRLLDKRKEKRPTAVECLKCGWLAQSEKAMNQVVIPTDKLKRFIIRRKWQEVLTRKTERHLG